MVEKKQNIETGVHSEEEIFDLLMLADIKTRFDQILDKFGRAISWLILIAMCISVYEVFMRYMINSPTKWVHEVTGLLVAIVFALGGVVTLARGRHIKIMFIYDRANKRNKRRLNILNAFLSSIYCLILSYATYLTFKQSIFAPDGTIFFEGTGSAWNPPFPPIVKGVILLSAILMLIQSILHIWYFLKGNNRDDI